jgi:hypothetical protein
MLKIFQIKYKMSFHIICVKLYDVLKINKFDYKAIIGKNENTKKNANLSERKVDGKKFK